MEVKQQIFFIAASIATLLYVILKIRKHKLNIDDSIIWILWAFLLLIFSIFPTIPSCIAKCFGFMSTSNFIFSLFVFFLYIVLFAQTIQISMLKEKNKRLIQKLTLKNNIHKKNDKC